MKNEGPSCLYYFPWRFNIFWTFKLVVYSSILWVTFELHKLCLPHSCSMNFRMLDRPITWCQWHQSAFSFSSDCLKFRLWQSLEWTPSILQGKTILRISELIIAKADGIAGSLDLAGLQFSVNLGFFYILSAIKARPTVRKASIIQTFILVSHPPIGTVYKAMQMQEFKQQSMFNILVTKSSVLWY